MKRNAILLMAMIILSVQLNGQVTVGSGDTPHESAVLDVKSPDNNKGFLGPRVTLTRTDVAAPVDNPATGLLVLCMADSPAGVPDEFKVYQNKFYYWSGTDWDEFVDSNRLENTISDELLKLGIPRIAFYNLIGTDNIAASGQPAKYGIIDFMKGVMIGNLKDIPLLEGANHTGGAVSMSSRIEDGNMRYFITFAPGIYNILFSYEFEPFAQTSTGLPNCQNSSYFMDFPLDPSIALSDRARIHSNAYHGTRANAQHGGSISYVVKLDTETEWAVRLGTGQAGDCTDSASPRPVGKGGFAIANNGTFLSILRIGND